MLKQKLKTEAASTATVLRVFSMVVENAQNMMRYSDEIIQKLLISDCFNDLRLGTIAVGHETEHYFVVCGNMIQNEKVEQLRYNLTQLKTMNKEELKSLYKMQRKNEFCKSEKGAGLGFIEMARKSSKPLEFDFTPIDDTYSFFTLKTVI